MSDSATDLAHVTSEVPASPDSWDDTELVRAILEGHPAAAKVAWQRFLPTVRRVIRRTMGPGGDLDDAVQDAFLSLFFRVRTLREPQALKGFVIAISARTAHRHIRRQRAGWFVTLSHSSDDLRDARIQHAECASQHALVRFFGILGTLKERDRLAFVLRFIEKLSATEVAAALGLSVATTRRRFGYAWDRVSCLAKRDAFLTDYLHTLDRQAEQSEVRALGSSHRSKGRRRNRRRL